MLVPRCATHQSSFSLFPPLTFLQLCQHPRVHGEGPFHSHPSGKLPRPCCRPLAGLQGALVSVAHPSTCRAPGAPRDGSAVTEQLAANRRVTWCKEWGARPRARRALSHCCAGSSRSSECSQRASGICLQAPHCTPGLHGGHAAGDTAPLAGSALWKVLYFKTFCKLKTQDGRLGPPTVFKLLERSSHGHSLNRI